MKNRSKINKGLRFENWLLEIIRERCDKTAHRNPASGIGLDKNDIRLPAFDIEIEAKNSQTINLIKDWEQVKRQRTGQNIGTLALRNPKKPEFEEVLIVMELGDWLDLLAGYKGKIEVINNLDYDVKYDLQILIEQCKKVIKKIEK